MKRIITIFLVSLLYTVPTHAQVNIGANETGLSIGNSRNWTGVRLNFRDLDIEEIRGVNITIWSPYEPASGRIRGLAIGLPSTGAGSIDGLGIGLLGIAATDDLNGVMIGGVGAGAGNDITGVAFGGLGLGAGGDISGIAFGGFGLGAGGDITGLSFGGFGLGAGGDITGVSFGGFGLAAGGDLTGASAALFGLGAGNSIKGIGFAGFGMGAGDDITGIHIAGFGLGAGGDITGFHVGGFGLGAGGTITGANLALIGIGAQAINGFSVSATMRADNISGLTIAPGFARINPGGELHGISFAGYHEVRGHTSGLSIGIVNYTRTLKGVQLGLINMVDRNPRGRRVLPLVNWNFN